MILARLEFCNEVRYFGMVARLHICLQSLALCGGRQEIHYCQELREFHKLISHDHTVPIDVENGNELAALIVVDCQRMRLAQTLHDADEFHRLQIATLVDVESVEVLVARDLKILTR